MRAKARSNFFRRTIREPLLEIDIRAVAIAHHRYYCHDANRNDCTEIDQSDIDYAEELAEVLCFLPAWPSEPLI